VTAILVYDALGLPHPPGSVVGLLVGYATQRWGGGKVARAM
jgi:hypothetical protein